MRKIVGNMTVLVSVLWVAGCSGFYYGYSKEQWDSMTRYEQEKARLEYKDVRYAHQQNIYGNPPEKASKAFVERALNTNRY